MAGHYNSSVTAGAETGRYYGVVNWAIRRLRAR